jgi:hypothetical protein
VAGAAVALSYPTGDRHAPVGGKRFAPLRERRGGTLPEHALVVCDLDIMPAGDDAAEVGPRPP